MKRFLLLMSMLWIFAFALVGCTEDKEIDISTVDIEAIDQVNIPSGTYTIPYTIEELSDLVKNYGAVVSFRVLDHDNQEVSVEGDTFVVEAGEIYTVTITLTVENQIKEKTITVTAIGLTTMVEVFFDVLGGSGYEESQLIEEGSVPNLEVAPEKEGYYFDGWYVDSECTVRYVGAGITEDTTLYANWLPIEQAMTSVSFDLNGGVGDFPIQYVVIGTTLERPQTEPTKSGYVFTGWYVDLNSSQPYDFETMPVYSSTTIYAHWEVDTSDNYTVTYDFNGAMQSEPILEIVSSGSHPSGLETTPVYSGFVFAGWSLDSNATVPTLLSDITVSQNITLYAVWQIDFVVLDGTDYFRDFSSVDQSTMSDGWVEQRINLNATFDRQALATALSLSYDFVEYGVLYGNTSTEFTYYDAYAHHVLGSYPLDSSDLAQVVIYDLTTDALLSEAVYFAVFYIRTADTILYSQSFEFQTCAKVQEGSVVGADYVLSGGSYKYDSGNASFRPSMFIEILSGYTALLDNLPYSSFSQIYSEGVHTLITVENSSGHRYLHVFSVDFQFPSAVISYGSTSTSDTSLGVTYQISFPHDEYIGYVVSEAGVLYSYDNPFVKLGLPGVYTQSAVIDYGMGTLTPSSVIASSGQTVYVRAYVIMNGKVSYSNIVTKLEFQSSEYVVTASYQMDVNQITPDNVYLYSFGATTLKLYTLLGNTYNVQDITDNVTIQGEGQYFITPQVLTSNSLIRDVLIINDYPQVEGVAEGQIYAPGVLITMDMYDAYWYYSINGTDYYYLPSSIRLTESGYYTIYYRSGNGMMEIHFEISSGELS